MLAETRQAMLLARLKMGLLPPEGPSRLRLLSQSDPLRAGEWMTVREALELATRGGARVLGRSDIGALEKGRCADFFTLGLDTIAFAGGLTDPVAAVVFCGPHPAKTTVINGAVVVEDGRIAGMDIAPVIAEHNDWSLKLAEPAG